MTALKTLEQDLLAARKEKIAHKDSEQLDIKVKLLTSLVGEAKRIGFDDGKRETTEEEVSAVIKKFLKGVNECLVVANSTAPAYAMEKMILESYLPQQMSEEELRTVVAAIINTVGSNKGAIMKELKGQYSGRYDGKVASGIIDSALVQ